TVNTTSTDDQQDPHLIGLPGGGFVVSWESANQDGDGYGVYVRTFDASGTATSGEILVNTATTNGQSDPEIASLSGGGFVVTWEAGGAQDGDGHGIYFQRFDDAGVRQGVETQVNSTTLGDQVNPRITGLNNGDFVVVWNDSNTGEVYGQRFDSTGASLGSEVLLNTTISDVQDDPEIVALSGGGYVVVWESVGQDGDGNGLVGRLFNSSGTAVSSEFLVNSNTTDAQQDPRVEALGDGGHRSAGRGRVGSDQMEGP
ncbi:MAG: RTX toxin, partial [Actinomycetota bacterium]